MFGIMFTTAQPLAPVVDSMKPALRPSDPLSVKSILVLSSHTYAYRSFKRYLSFTFSCKIVCTFFMALMQERGGS